MDEEAAAISALDQFGAVALAAAALSSSVSAAAVARVDAYGEGDKPSKHDSGKKSDNESYRRWLNAWGSFERTIDEFAAMAGGGKSAIRHTQMSQLLLQKLAYVPVQNLCFDIQEDRMATWDEVFTFVLQNDSPPPPVSVRMTKQHEAQARKLLRMQLKAGDLTTDELFDLE
jgi:hypothetical protein